MARELAGFGIRVNAVALGIVGVDRPNASGITDLAEKAIPLGQKQSAQSVADDLLFL
jgi:NAD(P)-dependent dehydrogenase (short-subunit alcohol dehydrogenase family)